MANAEIIRSVMGTITDDNLNTSVFAMQDGDVFTGDLSGHTMRYASIRLEWVNDVLWDENDQPHPVQTASLTITQRDIWRTAAEILGLTEDQARDIIFKDAETVDQLWELVTGVTGVTR